jgi:acetyltransferase-like isoleucine patch superfamily enzyme
MKAIISTQCRIRHPEYMVAGEYSIVDDFCYFSTKVQIGRCTHIASGCSIAGGLDWQFTIGDFCSLSSGVKIWCTSDDFANDVVAIIPPGISQVKDHLICGNVEFGNYTAVGSNSVVMPRNVIPEGTVVGALSFVPPAFEFESWSVYAGVPIRYLRPRNQESVMKQVASLEEQLRHKAESS